MVRRAVGGYDEPLRIPRGGNVPPEVTQAFESVRDVLAHADLYGRPQWVHHVFTGATALEPIEIDDDPKVDIIEGVPVYRAPSDRDVQLLSAWWTYGPSDPEELGYLGHLLTLHLFARSDSREKDILARDGHGRPGFHGWRSFVPTEIREDHDRDAVQREEERIIRRGEVLALTVRDHHTIETCEDPEGRPFRGLLTLELRELRLATHRSPSRSRSG